MYLSSDVTLGRLCLLGWNVDHRCFAALMFRADGTHDQDFLAKLESGHV